ncbi:MAG: non-heme iron oxygenase ferredoxin subunit [Myxococcales bacterium]|nr:non-heme iron oxygenase ferredoxin subunit [Myxococcales bacterium]MCB9644778.1 non-heme iron oxygenase ferredoxin subunit [Myxococcales bacterium]
MSWKSIAQEEEVIAEKAKVVELGDARIALFYTEGKIYAIDDRCPHVGASLACGYVKGLVVDCPWHHARFSLTTGANLSPPDFGPVRAYKTRIVDGMVEIDL